jgi:holliday junction DNA helicase RuvA
VVDVHGVGYEVHVPVSSFYGLGDAGSEVALRVHTHVREDALALFGFVTPVELQLFERLIAISGIGPKLALAVLSGIEPPELIQAVQRGDVARLTRIPGVGKKTAERIALELKDRLASIAAPEPEPSQAPSGLREDLVSALVNLGYHRPAVEKALDAVLTQDPGVTFEAALRAAFRHLGR